MSTWLAVVPVISPVEFGLFMADCRWPLENVLIVDNAAVPLVDDPSAHWRYHRAGRNLGVAGSWNLGVRAVLEEELDWLVMASTSFRFGPSGGMDFIEGLEGCAGFDGAQSRHGWHLVGLPRRVLEIVGEFDENFWPAYFEETDYLYRMGLAGLASPRENDRQWGWIDAEGDYGRQAATLLDGLAPVDLQKSSDYYERKWGGPQGGELFSVPFGSAASST